MEEKKVYQALTVYRERAAFLRRLEQFDKAKASYDEAYKHGPEDVTLLIGRSQVCADANDPQQSYADADAALKLDPRSMLALNVQAKAQYATCEFERSVVMNFRGSRERRCPPYFLEGIIQGMETLQDCVGKNAGDVLLEMKPIIRGQESYKNTAKDKERPHACRIPRAKAENKMTQLEKRKHEILSRVLAMKYLGPMAFDKFFLQELINDRRIPSANASGSRQIKSLAQQALQTLCEKQETFRTQRPYYAIKLAEKSKSNYLAKYKKEQLARERQVSARTADRFIHQIFDYFRANKMYNVISFAEQFQKFLDTRTPHTLPDKEVYIDRLYRAVGEAYLNLHRLSYKISNYSNRRRIAFLMGLPVGRPKSFDSITAIPRKHVEPITATEKLVNLIDMCENNFMRCCLYYEMARLQITWKNYAFAKFYAKRCQAQAHEIDCPAWWMNGCFVLIAGDMQRGNQNDVTMAIEAALEYSKKMKEPIGTQAFLRNCAELVADTVPDENRARKQREQQILNILGDTTKADAEVLLKRISRLPPGRRFEVLPRKRSPAAQYTSERRRLMQRGLTVVPGKEQPLPSPPRSHVRGYQRFRF
ncbi:hypothetical protein O0L34_g18225 [Tuta absoluta]|nr:hypothetical protein O0L34_g18225 [Tuta absoluta]